MTERDEWAEAGDEICDVGANPYQDASDPIGDDAWRAYQARRRRQLDDGLPHYRRVEPHGCACLVGLFLMLASALLVGAGIALAIWIAVQVAG
jgi:hypothetical protein